MKEYSTDEIVVEWEPGSGTTGYSTRSSHYIDQNPSYVRLAAADHRDR